MAKPVPNFHFFHARTDSAIAGIKASEVADPYGDRKGLVPSLVVGPQLRLRTERPVKWARIIPPGMDDLPEYYRARGGDDDKIIRGSILTKDEGGKKKSFLVSHRDEGAYYVLVRTGLKVMNGSAVQDRLEIQKDSNLVSHGSYSFDNASIRIAIADNEAALGVFTDPNASIGRVAAERLDTKVIGKRVNLIGGGSCPQTSFVLWKMPIGAVLIVRDVNGKMTRLVAQKDQLRVADATGYANLFPKLEEAYAKAREKEKEDRKTLQAGTPDAPVTAQ
jgi:hypothetical protein